jgi:hypothetical protein
MQTEQAKENTRVIDSQIGWKAMRELIRSIQEKKGGTPCFQTGKKFCDQYDCNWRDECKPGGV